MREKTGFIFDLDGVVYAGDELLSGAADTLAALKRAGKQVAYLTNNSGKSSEKVFQKLRGLGIACEAHEVITSGETAAWFIHKRSLDRGQGVFVVGTEDLKSEVSRAGLSLAEPQACGAVLAGFHPGFSYALLCDGLDALQRDTCFVACNRDANFPGQAGRLLPGCGPIVAALEAAAERHTDYDVGKPNTLMFDCLVERLGLLREQCVVIGDGLQSDIRMAQAAAVASVWVRGHDQRVPGHTAPKPDWIVADLGELGARLFA
ncbi:MAG TPA: HAD-IIA family hydrolase [Polyangiales bacterium]